MTKLKSFTILSLLVFVFAVIITGCVNYEQKTKLNADGSGTMTVHYWAKMSAFSMGTTLGKFEFEESKAKEKYKSGNTEVKSVTVADKPEDDSTKHVTVELSFKDITKLSDAKGFEGLKPTWKETSDGMELKYTVPKDTANSNQMGASDYKIIYEFDMPSEIVSTNGQKDGQKVKWTKSLSDLANDIEMTCVVKKTKGKTCGIFGIIGAAMLIGLAYYTQRNRKKNKS